MGDMTDRRGLTPAEKWLLTWIVLLAIGLRVWGIAHGLPYLYEADEPGKVLMAQRVFKTGDLNPRYFRKPSLFIYLNALSNVPYYLAGKCAGVFRSPADLPAPIVLAMGVGKTPMRSPFLLGRALTASFGSGAVVLVFLVGWQLTHSTAVGLLSALMMAISPTSAHFSHFIRSDTFLVFFALLSLWLSVGVFEQGRTWQYTVAGIAGGLAASSKYPGALILLCVTTAHFLRYGRRGFSDRRLYLAGVSGAAAFLATTPYALLDHRTFLADLLSEAAHYSTGHAGMEGNSVLWYLAYLWQAEGPVALLAILELVRSVFARSKQTLLLAPFPLLYFTFISSFAVRNAQTLLPLLPFLFLLASSWLRYLANSARSVRPSVRKLLDLPLSALVLVCLLLPLLHTTRDDVRLTTVDSRETARIWIERNLPDGARVAIESYAPYVDPQRFSVAGFISMIDHTPEWYLANAFDFLVFSEGMFGRFYREPDRYAEEISQYEDLFCTFDMLKTFTDGGYEVRIYACSAP
jgi:4-amino-4-deoxy-L-arabinose transferase-like glycosyltransferase